MRSRSTAATVRVYDSLGTQHDLTLKLTEGATGNTWDYTITGANGETINNGTGTLTFNPADGTVSAGSPTTITVDSSATTGVPPFDIKMDFSKFSQVATDTGIQASGQNGYAPGLLSSFSVDANGTVVGLFTNGLTRNVGQIALANFTNPDGLERTGNNLWRETDNSGLAVVGSANDGGRGSISSGFLEQSNVDISNEFADLIVTQRGFQANTKIVTVIDELLQDVINIKR
jgi:flagellar hook protein FlgE